MAWLYRNWHDPLTRGPGPVFLLKEQPWNFQVEINDESLQSGCSILLLCKWAERNEAKLDEMRRVYWQSKL